MGTENSKMNSDNLTLEDLKKGVEELSQKLSSQLQEIKTIVIKREKPFMTFEEGAAYLGLSKATLYSYTSRGIIAFHKLNGRRLYFAQKDLDDFILNSKNRHLSNQEIEEAAITKILNNS
jgi:excisionase family DNA binding protein